MNTNTYFFDLQLFAQDIEVVNTTSSEGLSPEMRELYTKHLLEYSKANTVFNQEALHQGIGSRNGLKASFRRPRRFRNAQRLTEGVIPPANQMTIEKIEIGLTQYGDYTSISDVLEWSAIDPQLSVATREHSVQITNTEDLLTRNALEMTTNVIYAQGSASARPTSRRALGSQNVLVARDIAFAAAVLKAQNCPTIGGKYIAIIHPNVAYDLTEDTSAGGWFETHKYNETKEILNGEIGELRGVRFLQTTNAKIYNGADLASNSRTLTVGTAATSGKEITFTGGTVADNELVGRVIIVGDGRFTVASNTSSKITVNESITAADKVTQDAVIYPGEGTANGKAVYSTLVFGADAFATLDPEGMGKEMIIKTPKEIGGPLEQFGTAGCKMMHGAAILDPTRIVRIESYCSMDDFHGN